MVQVSSERDEKLCQHTRKKLLDGKVAINSLIKIHNRAQLIKAFLNNRYFFGYCIVLCLQGNAANHLSFVEFDGNVLSMYPSLKFTALCCIVNFFLQSQQILPFSGKNGAQKTIYAIEFFFNQSLLKEPYPQFLPTSIYTEKRGQRGFILLNILRPNCGSRTLLARWLTN